MASEGPVSRMKMWADWRSKNNQAQYTIFTCVFFFPPTKSSYIHATVYGWSTNPITVWEAFSQQTKNSLNIKKKYRIPAENKIHRILYPSLSLSQFSLLPICTLVLWKNWTGIAVARLANKHNEIITDLLLLGWHALLQTGRAETDPNCQPDDAYSSEKGW